MPMFKVLVQRTNFYNRSVTEEKWFEVEADDDDDAMEEALKQEDEDLEKGVFNGWTETGAEEEYDDSEAECMKVEELPEKRPPDLPGQMKMFGEDE